MEKLLYKLIIFDVFDHSEILKHCLLLNDRGLSHDYCNRKLLISRAPTKAKSQEPAYSQALNQNKIDRQWSRSRESGRQMAMVDGAWS